MRRRYDRQGILALNPQAFFDMFVEVDQPTNETIGTTEIVAIRGPLEHHEGWWCDSYEAIIDRVAAACEGSASTIVLKLDSPGGELAGMIDCSSSIRARCKAAGKRLIAYVDGCACSSAYALACAAEQIVVSSTGFVGSIGVMISRVDLTNRDSAMGVGYAFVASGKRKADGNPHSLLSAAELAAMQAQCDSLAGLFFEHVSSLRGRDAKAIAALEAGVFHGRAAVEAGLADRVASFDELLASLANGGIMAGENENEEERTEVEASQQDLDDARAALQRAADDGDEKARRALAVLDGESENNEDEEDGEGSASASSSQPPASASRRAPRVSAESAGALGNTVAALARKVEALERDKEGLERTALLNSRPDLPKTLTEQLGKMPLAEARAIVNSIPKPDAPPPKKPAATAVVNATRGDGQGDVTAPPGSPETAELDRAFGIAPNAGGVRREGHSLVFEPPRPRALIARDSKPETTSKPAAAPAKG